MHLVRHGPDFEILFDDEQLMASWDSRSEEALATLVCARLSKDACRLLIGGLGMGFTLKAALAVLPPDASVVVAELVPTVVEWAQGALAHIFGSALCDPRLSLQVRDVHDLIVDQPCGFDAILLDVDNGPDGLISLANERLYSSWGLNAARRALRPKGVLAIWSAYPDQLFATRLGRSGFEVEEITIDAAAGAHLTPHTIWLATRLAERQWPRYLRRQ